MIKWGIKDIQNLCQININWNLWTNLKISNKMWGKVWPKKCMIRKGKLKVHLLRKILYKICMFLKLIIIYPELLRGVKRVIRGNLAMIEIQQKTKTKTKGYFSIDRRVNLIYLFCWLRKLISNRNKVEINTRKRKEGGKLFLIFESFPQFLWFSIFIFWE